MSNFRQHKRQAKIQTYSLGGRRSFSLHFDHVSQEKPELHLASSTCGFLNPLCCHTSLQDLKRKVLTVQ